MNPSDTVETDALWRIRDLARYLARSERWISDALRREETTIGSIPVLRLPGGAPRFDPEEIQAWVKAGCPPVATFRHWQKSLADSRKAG